MRSKACGNALPYGNLVAYKPQKVISHRSGGGSPRSGSGECPLLVDGPLLFVSFSRGRVRGPSGVSCKGTNPIPESSALPEAPKYHHIHWRLRVFLIDFFSGYCWYLVLFYISFRSTAKWLDIYIIYEVIHLISPGSTWYHS